MLRDAKDLLEISEKLRTLANAADSRLDNEFTDRQKILEDLIQDLLALVEEIRP